MSSSGHSPGRTRLVAGPFNRVEGDLEVTLDVVDGRVAAAWVNSPMYRGFEQILQGKAPLDALVFAPRICGICSVSQSTAAARALAQAAGVVVPPNGRLMANLALAIENLCDHLSHFYLFFMPDFGRDAYRDRPWHATAAARFRALSGTATGEVLPARAAFLQAMALVAGKWPHSLALQPGGSARAVEAGEMVRLLGWVREFRRFLERTLFGDGLERIAAIANDAELRAWVGARPADASDFRLFLEIAGDLGLERLGRAHDRFLSYGAYPHDGGHAFHGGIRNGGPGELPLPSITEDLSHSWMAGPDEPLHPAQGRTLPDADRPGAYSWCKAPRLGGLPFETGALARQVVNGHPLALDLVARAGGNVKSRIVARLLELALVPPLMEGWIAGLDPLEPFCAEATLPDEGTGTGLAESARGSLGHWVTIRAGRIGSYQIVSPTTWNFSPRDRDGTPGPLERALEGAPVLPGEDTPLAVQHIVRSFDPCMVCTVH